MEADLGGPGPALPDESSGLRLVIGLGNPGAEYEATRHNVGFRVVEETARRAGVRFSRGECNCLIARTAGALLALPQTFMNRSGHAARCLVEKHGVASEAVLVVLDEIALPLGKLRVRPSGSPGGHRGLESILESLQTDRVHRLRLGIRDVESPAGGEGLADYVLGPFAAEDRERVEDMVSRGADAVECWLADGIDRAMARFNG
jgi:peptidyl-tRNA hydrolase, PTH1 family